METKFSRPQSFLLITVNVILNLTSVSEGKNSKHFVGKNNVLLSEYCESASECISLACKLEEAYLHILCYVSLKLTLIL